jgi:class 3 adenylate cyclase/tetratricopeptide (TPR) repeat protein
MDADKAKPAVEAERKQITILFSDLSGYTALTEKLDPEEVKEVMGRIFGEIAQVVAQYEGYIYRLIGDQAMVLFGVPKVQEDDSFRAIRTAREIHERVDALSPQFQEKIGRALVMHSGINSGLVATGELDLGKKIYGEITGDTINLASRLCDLAPAREIWVGPETHRRAEGAFTFEPLGPIPIQGKVEPILAYKVLSARGRPTPTYRLSGLRADLIGRKAELAQLEEGVQRLREGEGTILTICGDPGTGKSRLVAEFKETLDSSKTQWLDGHAYPYSQNMPYSPVIDLLNRAWQIEEGDPPETAREKVESHIELLLGKKEGVAPYVGGLYALRYPEVEGINPELRKCRLFEALQAILSALTRRGRTILCLEDLQWADSFSLDLLRFLLSESRHPILFLCVYRLPFSLWTSHQLSRIGKSYQEIRLQDLSPSEAQDMMESLLKSKDFPRELRRFIQQKVEGNPFYLEEVMNSLIESDTLTRDNGRWKLARPLREADIPPTVRGVLSARIDRLDAETKGILQEASVIGRIFPQEMLQKITRYPGDLERCVSHLGRLDLIRTKALQPEVEYLFKHALTQEVAYESLLKQRRNEIHGRIAQVIEQVHADRMEEHFEILAHHYERSGNAPKAVDYLLRAGEKSNRLHAVHAAKEFFGKALELAENGGMALPAETKVRLHQGKALACLDMGNFDEAVEGFQKAIELCQSHGLIDHERASLAEVNYLMYMWPIKEEAERAYQVGMTRARELNDKGLEGSILGCRGIRAAWEGQPYEGHQMVIEGERLAMEAGDPRWIASVRTLRALTGRWLGRPAKTIELTEGLVEAAGMSSSLSGLSRYLDSRHCSGGNRPSRRCDVDDRGRD